MNNHIKLEKIVDNNDNLYRYELLLGKPNDIIEDFDKFTRLIDFIKENGKKNLTYHINLYPRTLVFFTRFIKKIDMPNNIVIKLIENHSTVPNKELEKVIKQLNIKMSIDDFGSGSSNFHRLELPNICSVKFERNLWNNNDNTPITSYLIQKLKKKNIATIAEKIENKEELNKVKKLGFNFFQGYFLERTFHN